MSPLPTDNGMNLLLSALIIAFIAWSMVGVIRQARKENRERKKRFDQAHNHFKSL